MPGAGVCVGVVVVATLLAAAAASVMLQLRMLSTEKRPLAAAPGG